MESYRELSSRHQQEINEFPLGAAFSDEQFGEMMRDWGFDPKHTYKICSLGMGMFCKKEDLKNFKELLARHAKELNTRLKTDDKFAYEAFVTEMYNHECGYTEDFNEAIKALGLSAKMIADNNILAAAYTKAREYVLASA